ncbi:hypothetical protein RFI_38932 [Reticulomyxa filosa]|nr:hypothetical protein RFI_38932 [Reticulomyxa filosa]|eukprot:ETN98561.1 hypothetical protein RFI_38932 [Reticulomyxa filosa]
MGLLAHFLAFAIKDLGFAIQDAYFSSSFGESALYFFIHICSVLVLINVLSFVRQLVCQTHMKSIASNGHDHNDGNDDDDDDDDGRVAKEDETVEYLYNEIEFDIWQVSMGLTLLEVILYMVSLQWIPIETTGEEHTENKKYGGYAIGVAASLALIQVLWIRTISFYQMQADRFHCKLLVREEEDQKKQSKKQKAKIQGDDHGHKDVSSMDDDEHNYSRQHKWLLHFAFRHRERIDRWSMFVDGFIGWAVGWTIVSNVFLQENILFRVLLASFFSFLGFSFMIWRVKSLREFCFVSIIPYLSICT